MKKDILAIGALAVVLALLLAGLFILQDVVGPTSVAFCDESIECANLSHDECEGSWSCVDHYCSWKCYPEISSDCSKASDCKGNPHIMCVGEWSCEDSSCSWACEVAQTEPRLDYEVSECLRAGMGGEDEYLKLTPTANGIHLEQLVSYVCCAEIELDIVRDGNVIRVNEKNVGDVCKCICDYEIEADITVLQGTYQVEVYGVEYPEMHPLALIGTGVVTVGKVEERLLFIETETIKGGELVGGDYPYEFTSGINYDFDKETRKLETDILFNDVMALYGVKYSLEGDAGMGSSARLYPLLTLPSSNDGWKITRIWDDGKVAMQYNEKSIELRPGEVWEDSRFEEDSGVFNAGLMELTTTETITNHGYIEL